MGNRLGALIYSVAFICLVMMIGTAQTQDAFRQKYGESDSKGRYKVRNNIGFSVKYKRGITPSEMTIEPLNTGASKVGKDGMRSVMASDEAEQVLDELVPIGDRGKKLRSSNTSFSCTSVQLIYYEQLIVNMTKRCQPQGGGTYSINIRWNS